MAFKFKAKIGKQLKQKKAKKPTFAKKPAKMLNKKQRLMKFGF